MLAEDKVNADDLASLGVTEPRCVARLLRLTSQPSIANLDQWLRFSQCANLRSRFEEQGFLSLECVLESGLLEMVQTRSSSLRRSDLESLGLKMKQRKNVERTLVQLKELGARAIPPLVLTEDMTPAERSDTAQRMAALLPQVQTQQSPSLPNPTSSCSTSPSTCALRSPAANRSVQETVGGQHVPRCVQQAVATPWTSPLTVSPEERVKSLLPSPWSGVPTTCCFWLKNTEKCQRCVC